LPRNANKRLDFAKLLFDSLQSKWLWCEIFKGGLPFAKMSAQIAAIYVCICILCAEPAPNFQLEKFLNCMQMHANMQQKCRHENYFWYKKKFVFQMDML
jgi:hypothetical protein